MSRVLPVLSRGMLILGGLMILAGLGWGIWLRVNVPPPPVITDAGAVVLAVTAPSLPATATPKPVPSPTTATPLPPGAVTRPSRSEGPTPALLPDWTVTAQAAETAQMSTPSTPLPASSPVPKAQEPPIRIVAPAIGLDAKVEPMGWEMVDRNGTMISKWVVPKGAAGWHINSGLPGHGENIVLSGHHNIEGKVFRHVVDLEPGDKVTLYVGDTAYVYIVTEKYILKEAGMPLKVQQRNAHWIMPSGDERLTLVTCWPYEWPGNSHRIVVVARPPEYFEGIADESKGKGAK